MMLELGVHHLVVVDAADRAVGLMAMPQILSALLESQDPVTVSANFAAVLFRTR